MDTTVISGVCTICYRNLNTGALFTGECSHSFHYNCISNTLQNGRHICPTCYATWTQVPSMFTLPVYHPSPFTPFNLTHVPPVDLNFDDDEPLPSPAPATEPASSSTQTPPAPKQSEGMTLKALPEYPALSKSEQSDSFAVLVGIRAPPLSTDATDMPNARAPIDLVAVLDVSGSMYGDKIRLLKQAVNFVINNLGPTDRLSIITFSTYAQRVTPFRRMTEEGRVETMRAVSSIHANGSTNIIGGLQKAVKVLEHRRQKNPVTSIIFLSDGCDTDNRDFMAALNRLPHSIRSNALQSAQRPGQTDVVPVHTFGFGADHDARALHAIADGSGGTFSFIQAIEVIQDAFAQCIGGLLSVVAQEVEIEVYTGAPNVQIKSISSGRYRNTIDSFARQHGTIYAGDAYAEEEKQFLLYLSVPQAMDSSTEVRTTKLLEVKCSYKYPLSNEKITSETAKAEIQRPSAEALSEEDKRVCLEVDREKNRILIAEGIAQAQVMAERGDLVAGRQMLQQQSRVVQQSHAVRAGDAASMNLFCQAQQLGVCMQTETGYANYGRAFGLSAQSSHAYQRASTTAFGAGAPTLSAAAAAAPSGSLFCAASDAAAAAAPPTDSLFGAGSAAASPTGSLFGAASAAAPPPTGSLFGAASAAPPLTGFGFQTSYMQKMVKKSQQERQSE